MSSSPSPMGHCHCPGSNCPYSKGLEGLWTGTGRNPQENTACTQTAEPQVSESSVLPDPWLGYLLNQGISGASSTLHSPSLASSFDGKGLADGNDIRATTSLHEVLIPVNQLSISKGKKNLSKPIG